MQGTRLWGFRWSGVHHWSIAVICCGLIGCGDSALTEGQLKTFPVRGELRYGTEPLPDATLAFHPVERPPEDKLAAIPRAKVGKDGTFTVTTYRSGDGAPPGEYLVTVSWLGPMDGVDDEGGQDNELPELLPLRYQDPEESGLRVEIIEGTNDLSPIVLADTGDE